MICTFINHLEWFTHFRNQIKRFTGFISGWLPGPILFGAVFDNACLLWQDKCGERGSCSYYDVDRIGLHVFILMISIKVVSLLFLTWVWLLYKPPKTEENGTSPVRQNKNEDGNHKVISDSEANGDAIRSDEN